MACKTRPNKICRPHYQTLEHRRVLTSFSFNGPFYDAEQTLYEAQEYESSEHLVNKILFDVNGRSTVVAADSLPFLSLAAGDVVTVRAIGFESDLDHGVFAAEGYIHKLQPGHQASEVDYQDGRFSPRESNPAANGMGGTIGGLAGEWIVEEGWERLSISLMHYTENGGQVVGRAAVYLQVGKPDLAFDTDLIDDFVAQNFKVGEPVEIPVTWRNLGLGNFHNYAEVDIYDSDDLDSILWAGALAGNSGEDVTGLVTNTRGGDGFDALWVPQKAGEYEFRYYLDPEGAITETNEANNEYIVTVSVIEYDYQVEFGEVLKGELHNDLGSDSAKLEIVQPENGRVKVNAKRGIFKYLSKRGFTGDDQFQYRYVEGANAGEWQTTNIEVFDRIGFDIIDEASGYQNSFVDLGIKLDSKLYSGAIVSGVPHSMQIVGAEQIGKRSWRIDSNRGPEFQLAVGSRPFHEFRLRVLPIDAETGNTITKRAAKFISVITTPDLNGVLVAFKNFSTKPNKTRTIPLSIDRTQVSDDAVLTLSQVPDFVTFNMGTRDGTTWQFRVGDIDRLRITSLNDSFTRSNISFDLSHQGNILQSGNFKIKHRV